LKEIFFFLKEIINPINNFNSSKMKIKIKTIILSLSMICLLTANIVVMNKDNNSKISITLNTLVKQAFADPEDDCQPACSPGFQCVNGVCVQLEAPIRTSCTALVWCWLKFNWIETPGHQTTCPPNPGGIPNCLGTPCLMDFDPC
jgi:hypothetical protein